VRLVPALARWAVFVLVAVAVQGVQAQPAARVGEEASVTTALHLVTLAERIAKLHAQIGQGILVERSRRALGQAIRDFEATLRGVAAHAPTAESRENYALLALQWHDYRDWAQRTPTRESARKLRPRTEEVVWVAGKGARMLQEHGRGTANASALRAAAAAALAQRIAKLHLWARWDIGDDTLAQELRASEENLRRALAALRTGAGKTPEIEAELQAADIQLGFMADAARDVRRGGASARGIEFIAKTGDHIFESMERVARLYEGAP
jgi:hypothetical protein